MVPGWYPDPYGQPHLRWWDGYAWTPNAAPFPGQRLSDDNTQVRILVRLLVGGLLVAGVVCSAQSVSLLTGMGIIWIGTAGCVLAFLLCFVPRTVHYGFTIVVGLVAALAIANAVYDYHQLDLKRQQINQIFNDLPS